MVKKAERLKPLSCYGLKLEDVIRRVLEVDPKPLWEQEREERKAREEEKAKNRRPGGAT